MAITLETIKHTVESVFGPKPVMVVVQRELLVEIKKLYEDGIRLPNGERPAMASEIHNHLRELKLNSYYDFYLGRDGDKKDRIEPYFQLQAGYVGSDFFEATTGEEAIRVLSFTRVADKVAKH